MKKITCTNEKGNEVYFDYNFSPFFLLDVDGLYGVENSIDMQSNTSMDGATYQGTNTKEKNIVITAQMCNDYQKNRDTLYKCFRPKTKGILVHEENGVKRQIEYYTESIDIGEKGVVRDITISLLAPMPFFTDEDYTIEHMATWTAGFEFEHEFVEETPEELGYRTMELIKEINNISTTDTTGMVIDLRAQGIVKNPAVRNITTGQFIKINTTMQPNDVIRIITENEKKDVFLIREDVKTSINGYIDEDSHFIQLRAGENVMQYEATQGKEYLNVKISYKRSYIGV